MNATLLPGAWWQVGSWRDRDAVKLDPAREKIGPVGYFNPWCKHERSSYDILTCDACVAYTKRLLELRDSAANAADSGE